MNHPVVARKAAPVSHKAAQAARAAQAVQEVLVAHNHLVAR